jgi:hypothetical protein
MGGDVQGHRSDLMTGELVASSTSRWGGACTSCHARIDKGAPIFKISIEGKTTQHGQGPGRWVCKACAPKEETDDNQGQDKEIQEAFDLPTQSGERNAERNEGHWRN